MVRHHSRHKKQNSNVIHEDFQILEGQQKGFKGASISVFHNKENTWKQAWADSNGDFFYFKGKSDGAKRIFQTDVTVIQDNKEFTQRMVFYDIKEDSIMWDWESSVDGGKTWTLNWRINYERVL